MDQVTTREIGGIIGVAVAAGLITFITTMRSWLVVQCKRMWNARPGAPTYLSDRSIDKHLEVQQRLVELRVLTGADRAFIVQFANGEYFSPSSPSWKLTTTHEVCAPAIRFCAEQITNLQVSLFIDVLGPIMLNRELAGISRFKCEVPCPRHVPPGTRSFYILDLNKMESSYFKQMQLSWGALHTIILLLKYDNNSFGMLGLNFIKSDFIDILNQPLLNTLHTKICESTEIIEALIVKQK